MASVLALPLSVCRVENQLHGSTPEKKGTQFWTLLQKKVWETEGSVSHSCVEINRRDHLYNRGLMQDSTPRLHRKVLAPSLSFRKGLSIFTALGCLIFQ